MRLPSAEHGTSADNVGYDSTVCSLRVSVCFPVCASHTFTSLALPEYCCPLADTMRVPSAENVTLLTSLVCPLRVSVSCPVCASHTFTVLSQLPETMRVPSGENATLETGPVCPLRVSVCCPVCASHTFTSRGVLNPSVLPDAMRFASALN